MVTLNRSTSNLSTDLGSVEYIECLELQKKLVKLRKAGVIGDTVLFLRHPPVYTIGRKADASNFMNVNPIRTERGGDVTYHGPGQLVVYFITDTRVNGKRDVRKLLSTVEEAVIVSLEKQGYHIHTGEKEPGFWNGDRKIGSLGMAMDDYISFHGISINTDAIVLEGFTRINPCGLNPELMDYVKIDVEEFEKDLLAALSVSLGEFRHVSYDSLNKLLADHESIPTSHILS